VSIGDEGVVLPSVLSFAQAGLSQGPQPKSQSPLPKRTYLKVRAEGRTLSSPPRTGGPGHRKDEPVVGGVKATPLRGRASARTLTPTP
jgi:hypothetical protein